MGVTGLWTIANPCARPVKLESLARKRLAVDASIWIYQFLKAVRDKEGHALQSSHIVGFFRRICKLLFFGIKPVFVFDGGAPPLKRQTIAGRKARREGREEDARRTAGRILALQVQRSADIEAERRRKQKSGDWEDVPDEEQEQGELDAEGEERIGDVSQLVYVDELEQTPKERAKARGFRKSDPYHLPELPVSMESLGAPNDPRVMSQDDLEEYARMFRGGEEVNLYDFSKIDFDSDFFVSLPMADRYNILNAARLRSRMRMGLAKEQLDSMFPNRMDFSKFQIERVKERNDLTQRLMNLNGMNDQLGSYDPTRVAGEKGREYVLVKNDGVEGGWVLGVVGSSGAREGERNKPIIVDKTEELEGEEEEDPDDDEDFEDVPVEGLNRLPHLEPRDDRGGSYAYDVLEGAEAQMLRRAIYESKRDQNGSSNKRRLSPGPISDASLTKSANPLFLGNDEDYDEGEDDDLFPLDFVGEERGNDDDDDELQKAIRLSLEAPRGYDSMELESTFFGRDLSDIPEEEEEDEPINNKGKGKAIEEPPVEKEKSSLLAVPGGDADFSRAVSESRRMNGGATPRDSGWGTPGEGSKGSSSSAAKNPFGGLLPFERLDMGKSMLFKGKRLEEKPKEMEKDRDKGKDKDEDDSAPLPPWFAGGPKKDLAEEMRLANRDRELTREEKEREEYELEMQRIVNERYKERDVVMIDSDDGEGSDDVVMLDGPSEKADLSMDGVADRPRTHPPKPMDSEPEDNEEEIEWEESDHEDALAARESKTALKLYPGGSPPSPDLEEAENGAPREVTPLEYADDEEQYAEPEDLELVQQLAAESEEHARFAAELNNRPQRQTREEYERELHALRVQQAKDRRDADEVTQVMVQECQQLLTLFGIPYITAPMEAEAQCAELVRLGLVDGIVTDDSDTFLFGGTRVYKNMFNQAKFVECYLASDLEKEYALDRARLIRIAHLLGSDYTEGVPTVGPVTAMELLAEFASDNGLTEFKEWWTAVQSGLRKLTDDDSPFRKKFRKNATKIFLPTNFPDPRVDEAYLHPEVDHDPSQFEWGMPDLDGLRRFLMATVGWSQERTDEVLVPVIKDMNTKQVEGTQSTITQFFEGRMGTGAAGMVGAPRRKAGKSKRMEKAMLSLHERAKRINSGGGSAASERDGDAEDVEDGEVEIAEKPAKRKRASAKKTRRKKSPVSNGKGEGDNEKEIGGEGYHGEGGVPGSVKKRKITAGRARK